MENYEILRVNARIDKVDDSLPGILGFCYSFMLVIAGSISFYIDTDREEVVKGELLMLTPLSLISVQQKTDDFSASILAIGRTSFGRIPNSSRFHALLIKLGIRKVSFSDETSQQIANTFSVFNTYLSQKHIYREGLTLTLLDFLLLQLVEELHSLQKDTPLAVTHKDDLLRRFLAFLSVYYKEEHGLQYYADKLCVSTTYLSRIIRETTGKTAYYFIADKLLATARHLLACTDLPISDIARELHFSDQSAFGKFFKSRVGVSPIQYRERLGNCLPQVQ